MRPIKLLIEGINSFAQMQTIDFDRLCQDNIFCISGVTGSGKTTIFDGIILALYGEGGRGKIADYINLDCDKAIVELRIEIGNCIYDISRTFYKKEKKSAKARVDRTENGTTNNVASNVDDSNALLLSLIGLTRKDFTQVILLEQGKFSEFLRSSPTERRKTVGKIFSLDKYGEKLTKSITTINDNNLFELNDKNSKLETYTQATCERLNEYELEKAKLIEQEKKITNQIIDIDKLRVSAESLIRLNEELKKIVSDVTNLRAEYKAKNDKLNQSKKQLDEDNTKLTNEKTNLNNIIEAIEKLTGAKVDETKLVDVKEMYAEKLNYINQLKSDIKDFGKANHDYNVQLDNDKKYTTSQLLI